MTCKVENAKLRNSLWMLFKTAFHFCLLHARWFSSFERYPIQTWVRGCIRFTWGLFEIRLGFALTRRQYKLAVASASGGEGSLPFCGGFKPAFRLSAQTTHPAKPQAMFRPSKDKIHLRELARRNLKRCRCGGGGLNSGSQ